MTFVSHAQNIEDMAPWRGLRDVEGGFHLDLGAAGPTEYPIAKVFYEGGWSGINIDPAESDFTALRSERKRDGSSKH